jgi:hypothetical protein
LTDTDFTDAQIEGAKMKSSDIRGAKGMPSNA